MTSYTTRDGTIVLEVPSTVEIHPAWKRWRFTAEGRYMVAPDGQHITQQRLEGLLWRDERSRRKAVKAVRLTASRGPS